MQLTKTIQHAIIQHAAEVFPQECCGIIVKGNYLPCRNVAQGLDQFEIHHEDLADAEDLGEIEAYVHSHPNASARASELDLIQIELHQKPWVICAYPDVEFQVYAPCGYKAPLVGRNYHHGWQDCYALIRDYYQRELSLNIPNFERIDRWWEDPAHASLYLDNFRQAGFYEVDSLQRGDVLICRVGRTEHPNHAVVYLANDAELQSEQTEPCIGSALILHHPYQRKSVREVYGAQWQERVVKIVRHIDVKNH